MVIIKELNCSILSKNSMAGLMSLTAPQNEARNFISFSLTKCLTNLRRYSGAAEV